MTKIELTPDWILKKLTDTWMTNGAGMAIIQTSELFNAHLITLALDTIGIEYEESAVGYDPDPEKSECIFQWEFYFPDIKDECPELYEKMYKNNESNSK